MAAETVELGTIYLVDLVGSTRLATSVGPVKWGQMREQFLGLLREAIDAFGGREFRNTGDGLMVAFASASAAVGCAVLTQQLFERRYRGAEQRLRVRIGLGTGESTIKDGDYAGMPATEATRLCDKAPADGILVSPATRLLAGRVDGARFESFGELELKGIAEPMEAFAVVWEPLSDESGIDVGAWPMPAALRAIPRVAYVGRVVERGMLERSRALARAGARQVVLVSGEPGIGKTRLASYAAHGANAEGFAVCWGACSEDLAAPYEPWIEVCSQLVEHAPGDVLAGYVAARGGEIGRLARNLARRLPDAPEPRSSDPETERFLLFKAAGELLAAVARSQPLCLVLDDFQWADGQSVALLKHVAPAVEQSALMVIVAYRDSDLTKDHPLTAVLADLRRSDGIERVGLTGLGAGEVAELMGAAAGHDLDDAGVRLASQIGMETGGNPFFVGEILRSLTESGAITFDRGAGRWSVEEGAAMMLPESVREVIDRRIDRLGGEARDVLTAAAVIGRSFDVALLERLVEIVEGRLLDQLEAAIDARLLRESSEHVGQFTFAHALINDTLFQGLGATRRARMHQQVAEALEHLYGTDSEEHLAELALHWRLATVSIDSARAARYSLRAGRRALDSLAPSEAVKLFGDALELGGQGATSERCEALIGLGEAQLQTGDAAYRATLLEASRIASTLADAELAARAALANSRGFASVIGETDEQRLASIDRALELDDPPQPARRARLLALQATELLYHPDYRRRWALADEAVALARQTGDTRTLALVLRQAWYAYWSAQTLELRSALATELAACTAKLQDPALQIWAHFIELHVCVARGELARAQAALERGQRIAEELGQPTLKWFSTFQTATWQLLHGDPVAAERSAERGFQIGQEAGAPDAIFIYGIQLTAARLHSGRLPEITEMLKKSRGAPGAPSVTAGRASILCWLDRRAEAAAILKQAASDRFEHVLPGTDELVALMLYADVAVQTGDTDASSTLYERIRPFGDQIGWTGASTYGHARMCLGLLAAVLGKQEEADRHLAFACEFQEANGMPFWAAQAHLGWAEALAARGDAPRAGEHAARALQLSREHGYGLFQERAAALIETQAAAQTDPR